LEKYVIEVLKSLINPNFKCSPFGGSDEGVVYWHLRSTRAMQHGQTFPLSYNKGTYNQLVTKAPFYGQLVPDPLFAIPPFNVYDVSKYLVVILT
jgi:hypothetical protein